MTDEPADDIVLQLASRLIEEIRTFADVHEMTAVDLADALVLVVSLGAMLLDCSNCRTDYIETLQDHLVALAEEDEDPALTAQHVH